MSRPAKSALGDDIKGHRTKQELEERKSAEQALYTGVEMIFQYSLKNHKIAGKEFKRIKKLFVKIKKDDDLYSGCISTYCLLFEECEIIQKTKEIFENSFQELKKEYKNDNKTMDASSYYRLISAMQSNIIDCDKQMMNKRKMMIDIAKENLLTCQSSLRSIPKKPAPKNNSRMAQIIHKNRSEE